MNNAIVFPMAIPLVTGVLLVFLQANIRQQRIVTILSLSINIVLSFFILQSVQMDGIQTIHFGGWDAPFGISFVADSFAMLLVCAANIVTLLCTLYAFRTISDKRERLYF